MSFLVDTDVLSDPTRLHPSAKVDAWLSANETQIYTSAITIGELKRGIERLSPGTKRAGLEKWLDKLLTSMAGHVLAYNARVPETWGKMMVDLEKQGHLMPLTDSMIAAIAKRHNLTLVTRNTTHFAHAGLCVINPFI